MYSGKSTVPHRVVNLISVYSYTATGRLFDLNAPP